MAKTNKQINKEAEVSDSDSSPAVVAYRVGSLEQTVKDGFKELKEAQEKVVQNFATKTDLQALTHRVSSLESDRKWLVRLVVGAVVFAVLALIGVGMKLN